MSFVNRKRIGFVFIAFILSISVLTLATNSSGLLPRNITFYGYVKNDKTNTAISGASVKIYTHNEGNFIDDTTTNSAGYFSITVPMLPIPKDLSLVDYYELRISSANLISKVISAQDFIMGMTVRLVPLIPSIYDKLSFSSFSANSLGFIDVGVDFTLKLINNDNYYTFKDFQLVFELENTRYFNHPQPSVTYYEMFGWCKIPLDLSVLAPSATQWTSTNFVDFFKLYIDENLGSFKGLFALNGGDYLIKNYYVRATAYRGTTYVGTFRSTQTLSISSSFSIKEGSKHVCHIFMLYDTYWKDHFGKKPGYFIDQDVNPRFLNEFNLEFRYYEDDWAGVDHTYRDTHSLWYDYVSPEVENRLGINLFDWETFDASSIYRTQRDNHGFDNCVVFLDCKGPNWGVNFGANFIICYTETDHILWADHVMEFGYVDNVIQHELSHSFKAIDHEYNLASIMTYMGFIPPSILPIIPYYVCGNWLNSDITLMEESMQNYWVDY
ncbi:MAG: carboxypeptidase regulatory-like domain-containing protein [Candidatus Heimdallarchaeota archaeon]|nr:carboxypeptidase regulatory-like domain-containing protein [Candidatus Heimdallarchaeota archaeon]